LPDTISEMATDTRSTVLTIAVAALILGGIYLIDPTFFGLLRSSEGFATMPDNTDGNSGNGNPGQTDADGETEEEENKMRGTGDATVNGTSATGGSTTEQFANYDSTGPADFGAAGSPAGCYPRDQLTPGELLPKDQNSVWAQQNPMGTGSLKGKNFLSAGALIGINTVGQSMRNANYQLRSEPPNPQVPVSVFNNSTIEPDVNRRDFEVN
jgi:hypothetical protein